MPRLPVIPLGIDTESFIHPPDVRAIWRERLGAAAADVVFLFMGRLSFHAKANPFPLYVALEETARRSPGRRLHLVQAGWFANTFIEKAFRASASNLCPSINVVFLDGRQPEVRREIWAAADVFVSLVDNIQESFGLTPVEAMAAGLPVVVSDWNGYRDIVRDGLDGFRIPTLMAPEGADLAERYAAGLDNYDVYCGLASQFVAVDINYCVTAFLHLINDPALRARLGEEGRRRAVAEYDWQAIIPRYQDLWAILAEERARAAESAPPVPAAPRVPARPDPYMIYHDYPTEKVGLGHRIVPTRSLSMESVRRLLSSDMVAYARRFLPSESDLETVVEHVLQDENEAVSVGDVVRMVPVERRGSLLRTLVWMHKYNLVVILPPSDEMEDS
ncbi:MAG: putative Glycosyl transferase-like protein [Rhodospirillaceae bacterium]|nr:MAG: putative Glycosyl transferase-like protein [Rhodospirillaceae bacterium]